MRVVHPCGGGGGDDDDPDSLVPLTPWLEFGDARFAPYVPACSVNEGQSLTIRPNYYY